MIKCSCCKEYKETKDFPKNRSRKNGFHNECKSCGSIKHKIYREKNKEKEKIRRRNKYLKNREIEIKKDIEYKKKRASIDPSFKMIRALRDRHCKAVKNSSKSKKFHTKDLLGCDSKTLKEHFENLFISGMSWENHGIVWHIDHIYPLSKVNWDDPEEVKKYCHFTNLRPLLVEENLKKSNKILYFHHGPEKKNFSTNRGISK